MMRGRYLHFGDRILETLEKIPCITLEKCCTSERLENQVIKEKGCGNHSYFLLPTKLLTCVGPEN